MGDRDRNKGNFLYMRVYFSVVALSEWPLVYGACGKVFEICMHKLVLLVTFVLDQISKSKYLKLHWNARRLLIFLIPTVSVRITCNKSGIYTLGIVMLMLKEKRER